MSVITFKEEKDHFEILKIFNNIRDLNIIIEFAKQAYVKFEGEISRTDILYASVLRHYKSGFFWDFTKEQFSRDNNIIHTVKKIWDEKEGNPLKDQPEWKNLSQTVGDEVVENAIYSLVLALLEKNSIQSAASSLKYRKILMAAIDGYKLTEGFLSDQKYLNAVSKWKAGHQEPFVSNLIESKEWCDSFEYFQKYIQNEKSEYKISVTGKMMQLISEFNNVSLKAKGKEADSKSCQGFIPLWRQFINGSYIRAEPWITDRLKWILEEGNLAMGVSFSFFLDFDYYWLSGNGDLYTQDEAFGIRKARVELFFNLFEHDINKFLSVLPDVKNDNSRFRLYQFIEHSYTTKDSKRIPLSEADKLRVLNMIDKMFEIDPKKTSLLAVDFFVDRKIDFRDADTDPETGNYLQGRSPQAIYTFKYDDHDVFKKGLLEILKRRMPLSLRESDPACKAIYEGRAIQNSD